MIAVVDRFWDEDNRYVEGFLKEYSHWVLEVSYGQHTLGSYIIFAKSRVERISELRLQDADELIYVMGEMETALSKTFKPD